jgi:hypothetical protein
MSDHLGRWIPWLDPSSGNLALPLWAAGAIAALIVVFLILAFNRAGSDGMIGSLSRVSLMLVGAAMTWVFLQGTSRQDTAAERRSLETRISQLAMRATMPGSPLACLDAMAGDAVEGACERALFATPEAMASAVSYVAAQWNLFADVADFVQRGNAQLQTELEGMRRAIEADRFGLVAHVLTARDGCTPQVCPNVTMLQDGRRVTNNITQHTYEFYVGRHSTVWPAAAPGPTANAAPSAIPGLASGLPSTTSAYATPPRIPGPDVFFPSSDSIPPVNILTSEPAGAPESTGTTRARTPPPRRPVSVAPQQ